jgi:hypothetical protein
MSVSWATCFFFYFLVFLVCIYLWRLRCWLVFTTELREFIGGFWVFLVSLPFCYSYALARFWISGSWLRDEFTEELFGDLMIRLD